jgi:hypothetical protein
MKISGLRFPLWKRRETSANEETSPAQNAPSPSKEDALRVSKLIEDFGTGYPRFSALLSVHPPFFVCRRFDRLRARLLLLKQDKLSLLKQQLDQVDQREPCPLFLGKSRGDRNAERASLLSAIEACLTDYGRWEIYAVFFRTLIGDRYFC